MMFFRRGKSGCILCPTVADLSGPTVAEIAAGTPIGRAVNTISGFETSLNRINTAVMAHAQELQTPGPQPFVDASMVVIEDDGTGTDDDSVERQDAYDALVDGTTGVLVFIPQSTTAVAGTVVETWPIEVGARNRSWSLDAETARYGVQYAITGTPVKDAVVVA